MWNKSSGLIILKGSFNGPLTRYAKLRVAHALGMPGMLSPPPPVSDPDMHHSTCVTHVQWYMTGSLNSGFLWSRWWGKRSRHSRCMRNPHFCVSGKRPMPNWKWTTRPLSHPTAEKTNSKKNARHYNLHTNLYGIRDRNMDQSNPKEKVKVQT